MADYLEAFKKTMGHEGGYSHDSDDAGGETFKGISRKYHPDWHGWDFIDELKLKHGNVFPNILFNYQELEVAVQVFYKKHYWNAFWGDEIKNQGLAEELFDTSVNMGTHRAVNFLQQSLNFLNRQETLFDDLVEDGKFGKRTSVAIEMLLSDREVLLKIMNVLQGMHYLDYMKKSPTQEKYCRGWFKRVNISK